MVDHELGGAIGHVQIGGDAHPPFAALQLPHRVFIDAEEVPIGEGRRRVRVGVGLDGFARVAHARRARDGPWVGAVGALRGELRLLGGGDAHSAEDAEQQRAHCSPLVSTTRGQAADTLSHWDRSSP